MKHTALLLTLLISCPVMATKADMTPDEKSQLLQGKMVKRVINLKGKSWPQVTIMQIIPNSPKQNMDVYTEFDQHKNFIPDLIKSKIISKTDKEIDVAFEMKMPFPVPNSIYTTKNIFENSGEDYKLSWTLIKANQLKATEGSVIFESYEGKTLFTYINHITPDSSFAGMFKGRVDGDVEKTVKIIIKHLGQKI
jgi:hypothetical protein